jgi:hypothetical protein
MEEFVGQSQGGGAKAFACLDPNSNGQVTRCYTGLIPSDASQRAGPDVDAGTE